MLWDTLAMLRSITWSSAATMPRTSEKQMDGSDDGQDDTPPDDVSSLTMVALPELCQSRSECEKLIRQEFSRERVRSFGVVSQKYIFFVGCHCQLI